MRMPPSYPLRSVELESKSRLGVSEAQWRKWLLSMTTLLLTHVSSKRCGPRDIVLNNWDWLQDGTILDGVLLWKQNLDKHFEGVECCPICYSLFHMSDHSLPRLACKTCHNKFHSACMVPSSSPAHHPNLHSSPPSISIRLQYKWIRVSHNTDCPLCKTPFN